MKNLKEDKEMTRLLLNSIEGFSVSYELSNIKNIEHGKAKKFYDKSDCERNGLKLSDSVIKINFISGDTASFCDNWRISFD
ncbi:MAG TPA: hypothetical protein GX717_08660 [Clostridiaceae bacterium]|nr:hypothetical protein [Clostridiaceae bacterium]